MLERLWEEEFSIVFSLIYLESFLRIRKMDKMADKVLEGLEKIPKRTGAVRKVVTSGEHRAIQSNSKSRKCYQRVHSRVREFIFGNMIKYSS